MRQTHATGRHKRRALMALDVIGCVIIGACTCGIVAIISTHTERQQNTIPKLKRAIGTAAAEIESLEAGVKSKQNEIGSRQLKLGEPGRLPKVTNMEAYVQTLTDMAETTNVRITLQKPLAQQSYPGLHEDRFLIIITGPGSGIVEFLQAVENSGFWADISYLNITNDAAAKGRLGGEPSAEMTFSLFSHRVEEEPTGG